jgi:phosphoesterase RecJ-like protein
VNALAREHFSGGGHKNAAGGISYEGLEKTIDKFVQIFQAKTS